MEKIIIGEALLILGLLGGVNIIVYIVHPKLEEKPPPQINLIQLDSEDAFLAAIHKPDRSVEYMILTRNEADLIGGGMKTRGINYLPSIRLGKKKRGVKHGLRNRKKDMR